VESAERAATRAPPPPRAAAIVDGLQLRGVAADARGGVLRLGPAPYLVDRQIDDALTALGDTVRALG
jgi:kynureninase